MDPIMLLGYVIIIGLNVLKYAILIQVITSWLPSDNLRKLDEILGKITEPVLSPIRNILNKLIKGRLMMIDFSPIVAFLIIYFLEDLVTALLFKN